MLNRKIKVFVIILCLVFLFSFLTASAKDYKVSLNLFERLVTMGLLPKEGNFATLKIITELSLMLAPTDEENKTAGLETQANGSIIAKNGWLAIPEKEIILGEIAYGIITEALKKLDEGKLLTLDHMKVYEKFIVNMKEGE